MKASVILFWMCLFQSCLIQIQNDYRMIQTYSNKYVQALHLFGRAFRRCPRVCVERDGEHVVNVAAVELARRKLSQAFKHQVSVEPIAVDQSGAGR